MRQWDADQFHARVMELEKQGYVARRESYRIAAEMNPETGSVSHVHSIGLAKPEPRKSSSRESSFHMDAAWPCFWLRCSSLARRPKYIPQPVA